MFIKLAIFLIFHFVDFLIIRILLKELTLSFRNENIYQRSFVDIFATYAYIVINQLNYFMFEYRSSTKIK